MEWIRYESIKDLPDVELLLCIDNEIYTFMDVRYPYEFDRDSGRAFCTREPYQCCQDYYDYDHKGKEKYYMILELPKKG